MTIPSNRPYPNKFIEFKYLKIGYTQKVLQQVIQDAREQIIRYKHTRQMHREKCEPFIFVFSKKKAENS